MNVLDSSGKLVGQNDSIVAWGTQWLPDVEIIPYYRLQASPIPSRGECVLFFVSDHSRRSRRGSEVCTFGRRVVSFNMTGQLLIGTLDSGLKCAYMWAHSIATGCIGPARHRCCRL